MNCDFDFIKIFRKSCRVFFFMVLYIFPRLYINILSHNFLNSSNSNLELLKEVFICLTNVTFTLLSGSIASIIFQIYCRRKCNINNFISYHFSGMIPPSHIVSYWSGLTAGNGLTITKFYCGMGTSFTLRLIINFHYID